MPIRTEPSEIESISAVTLVTTDMEQAVSFYQALGFPLRYGGPEADFTSFLVGDGSLNLMAGEGAGKSGRRHWGRLILYVADVDSFYRKVVDLGYGPEAPPRDAEWGERYFHLNDPDGHQLSFAHPL